MKKGARRAPFSEGPSRPVRLALDFEELFARFGGAMIVQRIFARSSAAPRFTLAHRLGLLGARCHDRLRFENGQVSIADEMRLYNHTIAIQCTRPS